MNDIFTAAAWSSAIAAINENKKAIADLDQITAEMSMGLIGEMAAHYYPKAVTLHARETLATDTRTGYYFGYMLDSGGTVVDMSREHHQVFDNLLANVHRHHKVVETYNRNRYVDIPTFQVAELAAIRTGASRAGAES